MCLYYHVPYHVSSVHFSEFICSLVLFPSIRYALYEYWLRHYSDNSYILILDFRDTFFQGNPFQQWGTFASRTQPSYDLQMYAENNKVSK